jgi:large subunit ribosomal protein L4
MMPKKQRRLALFSALSEKVRDNQVIGLEGYKADKPKTQEFAAMIKKLPIKRSVLIVLPGKDMIVEKSVGNLTNAKTIFAPYLNIRDLRKYRTILLFKDAVAKIKETFLTKTTLTKTK